MDVALVWQRDLVFTASTGDIELTIDSNGQAGPSPVQALAIGLAGCMSIDVVHILRKGRHDVRGLQMKLSGDRAPQDPKRFEKIAMHFVVSGTVPRDAVERAIALSREKYCSVWHSMRQDIELTTTYDISEFSAE